MLRGLEDPFYLSVAPFSRCGSRSKSGLKKGNVSLPIVSSRCPIGHVLFFTREPAGTVVKLLYRNCFKLSQINKYSIIIISSDPCLYVVIKCALTDPFALVPVPGD